MSRYVSNFVERLAEADLHEANKLVNARIAEGLRTGPLTPQVVPASDQIADYLLNLGDGSREFEGMATGMDEFDRLIGGLNRFVLLAARAGAGKSMLAIQLALGTVQTGGTPVLYYSFEMPRRDVLTMMLQNLRRGHDYRLTRKELVLHGNKPISSESGTAIAEATTALRELAPMLYIVDAADGEPSLARVSADIKRIQDAHGTKSVLVIVDSLQDLVNVGDAGATAAEAETAQEVVELQQATEATFLCISQKSKSGSFEDPYAGVLGSVSLIHKPTSVVELLSVYDLIRQVKDRDLVRLYSKLADVSDVPNPVICRVVKGRNNGHGHVALQHYGRYGYFEPGKVRDFDVNTDTSLYDLVGL